MRPRQWTCGLGLAGALLVVPGGAHAQDRPEFSLEWSSPAGCPDGDAVRKHAESLLGGPIEARLARPLGVSGAVTHGADRFALDLATVDNGLHGERHLSAPTCEELASAAALIVALAVDPKAVAERSSQSDSKAESDSVAAPDASRTPVETGTQNRKETPSPTQPEAQTNDREEKKGTSIRVGGFVEGALVGDVGTLPGVAVGPLLSGGVALGRVRVRVGGSYFAPRFAEAPAVAGKGSRGGDVSLLVVDLAGCYAFTPRSVELAGCLELEGGALLASGSGFDQSNDATRPWLGGGGHAELTVPITGPMTFRVALGVMLPFARSAVRFRENTGDVTEIQEIHRPSVVSGRASLGIGLAFW